MTVRLRGRAAVERNARVLDRYAHTCAWCHVPCPHPQHHEVDHRIRLADGGADSEANLAPLCRACHLRKSAAEASGKPLRRAPEPHPGSVGGGM